MNTEVNQRKTFLKGAVLLSVAALLTKIISAGYRIPYQNMAGDLGFYVYQQIYPFYGFMAIVSLYGFPVVLSRQLAENNRDVKATTGLYFIGLFLFSLVAVVLMVSLAPWLAVWMGDDKLTSVLRITGFSFLFLPFLSVARGVTQGQAEMLPTAVSNVGEQLVRVTAILLITYLLMRTSADAYQLGSGAILGSLLGSLTGVIILFVYLYKMGVSFGLTEVKLFSFKAGMKQVGSLLGQSVFICMNALVLILFQFVDVFSMIHLLQIHGVSETQAYHIKGIYDRGQPLLQLGTILATTMALAIVPALAQARARNNHKEVLGFQDMAVRLALLIGGAATIGLIIIMGPVNHMLFTDQQGSMILRILVLSIAPCSIYLTGAAILQGYGHIRLPAFIIGIGLVVKLLANVLLTPIFGAGGAAAATTLAFTVMALLGLYWIKKVSGKLCSHPKSYQALFLTLAILSAGASIGYWLLSWWLGLGQGRLLDTGIALAVSGVGGIIVLICIIQLPIFTSSEWDQVPKLKKLKGILVSRKE
ncbi:putative polysaccharide biosynthesis protein [Alkalicoccobacillus murimartini]|uniref:PST family polysaccharide transporter n=1 Tax=Alkalicoccobacillus murimartini TaxID=171685 RepID=A0ABT9YMU4_9BACI|nr:polysaccharide biosynthesis protein [Alkalicoccobacillus murimartini]MDQ0209194.1 PST family polysaccharide transporter [Alkalicoccobacillus murimartini]